MHIFLNLALWQSRMAESSLPGNMSVYCYWAGLRIQLEGLDTLVTHSSVGSDGYELSLDADLDDGFCHHRLNYSASMLGCAEYL